MPQTLRLHSVDMSNFLFGILSNLALLAIVLIACHVHSRLTPGAALNGARIFVALELTALLLDTTLTFLVFADAQSRYGPFCTPAAFFRRVGAYGLAMLAAFAWHYVACRTRPRKTPASKTLVIRTSPYSESHLPM
ncbi:hypothetical protein [Paraburkholderia sp. BL21I4N1]|uniref:hypothetical protein n=1 Tax=Paraburkholderia sp. BL21I4N1 TaxID=1938801 RepID=UPI000D469766|nr:hypothetical protein B0G83_103115 [Paraburkholderia sp. BL21I4N1]